MILAFKVDESRRNPQSLKPELFVSSRILTDWKNDERIEHAQSLRYRETEISTAMNDELRSAPTSEAGSVR